MGVTRRVSTERYSMRRPGDDSKAQVRGDGVAPAAGEAGSDHRWALAGAAVTPISLLLRGRREMLIEHAGQIYRLQVTRNNKLILTK